MNNIKDLTTEYRINPIGIDIIKPRFAWKIVSEENDVMQQSYQIKVIDEDGNKYWNSETVITDKSVGISYAGNALKPKTKYIWTVKVTDNKGNISISEHAYFETGFLEQDSWSAKWIESKMDIELQELEETKGFEAHAATYGTDREGLFEPPILFRKKFTCEKELKKSRFYITAHGVYSVSINGQEIRNCILAPEMTTYETVLQYQTYDMNEYLKQGENVLIVTVATGWYCGSIGMTGNMHQFGDKVALLGQIELEYTDGSKEIVITDETFRTKTGKYCYADLFVGVKYDNRVHAEEYTKPEYSDKEWDLVEVKEYGYESLIGQKAEPIVRTREVSVSEIITTPKGETILDFGQVVVGCVRMKVTGQTGDTVILVHTEELDKAGNFMMSITGNNKDQTDIYILRGKGEEEFEPEYTYHGFRYVKITGYPGEVKPEKFKAIVIGNQLEETSCFSCSDSRLTRLYENVLWSQRGNMVSIPTDCPQREKAGWLGDIMAFSSTACWNMNMDAFLSRWLEAVGFEQRPDGQVPYLVPFFQGYDFLSNMLFGGADQVASCGWGDAIVVVPWNLYSYYNDIENLERCYPFMKKWMEYVEKQASENIVNSEEVELTAEQQERQKYLWNTGFHFGDWLLPSVTDLSGGDPSAMFRGAYLTKETVATCYYAYTTAIMHKVCTILGRKKEAVHFEELNKKIRKAFAEEYLHEDGTFDADVQGVYVLALYMKAIPDEMRDKVSGRLVHLIEGNRGCLDTGFLSAPFLLDALVESGHKATAYKVLFNNQMPSWLYQVEMGATTMWESWSNILPDGTRLPMSYNHYASGCVQDFIFRHIAGITMEKPGFKKMKINPDYACGLDCLHASYNSIYGKIVVAWEIINGNKLLRVTIPPNTTAEIYVGDHVEQVGSGNYEYPI